MTQFNQTRAGMFQRILAAMDSQPSFLALCAILAALAGISRSLQDRTKKTRWVDVFAAGLVSVVAGLIVSLVAMQYSSDGHQHIIAASSALAGWIGRVFLDILGGFALRRVRRDLDELDPRE